MQVEEKHITTIRETFQEIRTKEDLLIVMNYAKKLVYGEKAVPFELKQLTYYSLPNIKLKSYQIFQVKKKSGGARTIHAPVKGLKAIQRVLAFVLQCVFEPHQAAMGFIRDKSIVENAKIHAGNYYVFNVDLKDFFPSVDQARVWKCLQLRPFNLTKEATPSEIEVKKLKPGKGKVTTRNGRKIYYHIKKDGRHYTVYKEKGDYKELRKTLAPLAKQNGDDLEDAINSVLSELFVKKEKERLKKCTRLDLANLIASLCCTKMEVKREDEEGNLIKQKRNVLPQGAPTSPILTNVVCQRLDYLLTGLAKRFGLRYTRYADDITFSSLHNVYQKGSAFRKELERIITDQNFRLNPKKTRLQKEGYRQEVTGLVVNDKVNVRKRYVKQLRMWLYYWERYGYDRANQYFVPQYMKEKGHIQKGYPNMANVIDGKLNYLKMVKGGENGAYTKLQALYDKLIEKDKHQFEKRKVVTALIESILKDGVDRAMEKFNI